MNFLTKDRERMSHIRSPWVAMLSSAYRSVCNMGQSCDVTCHVSHCCHVSRGHTHLVQGERHDGVILLQHGLVTQLLEVVRSDSVMRVRGQNVLPVLSAHMSSVTRIETSRSPTCRRGRAPAPPPSCRGRCRGCRTDRTGLCCRHRPASGHPAPRPRR